jgi:hypothetical protein
MTIALEGAADRVTQTGPDGRFVFESFPAAEYELGPSGTVICGRSAAFG